MQEFRRRGLLRAAPVVIPVAVITGLALPRSSGLPAALIILAGGVVTFVVPYWSDRVVFGPDGGLTVNRLTIAPEQATRCRYHGLVSVGRGLRFSAFALYTADHGAALPAAAIPTVGWLARDRPSLFAAVHQWLDEAGIAIDARSRDRLERLESG